MEQKYYLTPRSNFAEPLSPTNYQSMLSRNLEERNIASPPDYNNRAKLQPTSLTSEFGGEDRFDASTLEI